MMVNQESYWSCHANDAMTAIQEVLGFESAIDVAIAFANDTQRKH